MQIRVSFIHFVQGARRFLQVKKWKNQTDAPDGQIRGQQTTQICSDIEKEIKKRFFFHAQITICNWRIDVNFEVKMWRDIQK